MKLHPLELMLLENPMGAFDEFNNEYVLPELGESPKLKEHISETREMISSYFDELGKSHLVFQYMQDMASYHLYGSHL